MKIDSNVVRINFIEQKVYIYHSTGKIDVISYAQFKVSLQYGTIVLN